MFSKSNILRNKGFTLIELSIVLVIIGLLAAGILVGRDLIRASEIRAQVSQIEKIEIAINAFRSKYNCIPGDCENSIDYDLGDPGNGSGVVGDWSDPTNITNPSPLFNEESVNLWIHLASAQLIENNFITAPPDYSTPKIPGKNSPPLKIQGLGTLNDSYTNGKGGFWIPTYVDVTTVNSRYNSPYLLLASSIEFSAYRDIYDAGTTYAIDIKIDDGLPFKGKMIATSGWANIQNNSVPFTTVNTGNLNACINGTSLTYNVSKSGLPSTNGDELASLCTPIIKSTLSN